jgi:hyperosmotically inducible periplasmic protein
MKQLLFISFLGLALAGCERVTTTERTTTEPDNTGKNVRDRDDSAKTPINQNENQPDLDITAKIRKQVVDTEMSVNAQNVKIMTQDGKVTLRGPVKTAGEKAKVEEIARGVAGAGNVTSELEVE